MVWARLICLAFLQYSWPDLFLKLICPLFLPEVYGCIIWRKSKGGKRINMKHVGNRDIIHPDGSTKESWHTYTCGYCNVITSGAVVATYTYVGQIVQWLLCTNCYQGSVKSRSGQIEPGVMFGPVIEGLPENIAGAYNEARNCFKVSALTACELISRKILMHVAVNKGADEGKSFATYLNYLEDKGYVTPPMKGWVDLIRQHGNLSTHVIEAPDRQRAESTLMFTAELLRLVYEMEHLSNKYKS